MKRKHKKIFGLFGLVLVAAVTAVAAFLPVPETLAADQGSFTDNISVRVISSAPNIGDIDGIEDGTVSIDGRHTVTIPYAGVESITVKIIYTDPDGNVVTTTLPTKIVDYEDGIATLTFDTLNGDYDLDGVTGMMDAWGYGDYEIEVIGIGPSGDPVGPKTVEFETDPVGGGTQIVKEEGAGEDGSDEYYLEVEYDNGEGGGIPGGADVDHLEVIILDENGNQVGDPLIIQAPETKVKIPFNTMGEGKYTFNITPYDANGNVIYKSPAFTLEYTYKKKPLPVPKTADTGGMMGNLNISKTDYIITGLIIFGIIGISAAVFITRHDKKAGNRRK